MRTSIRWFEFAVAPRLHGRAVAQALSHRPPQAAARFRALVRLCGVDRGQSGTEQISFQYFGFTYHSFIFLIAPKSLLSSTAGKMGRQMAAAVVNLIPIQSHS